MLAATLPTFASLAPVRRRNTTATAASLGKTERCLFTPATAFPVILLIVDRQLVNVYSITTVLVLVRVKSR